MFLCLLFLVALLLQFGESHDQCVREIRLLKHDIQTTVRSTIIAESITGEDVQELVEDKATKEDVRTLNQTIATGVQHMMGALAFNQNVTREDVQELVEDIKAMKEEVQTLKQEVSIGNLNITNMLNDTKSIVEATNMVIEQEQCVTREEVNTLIHNEIQPLLNHVQEQQNSIALLLQTIKPGTLLNPAPSCKNIPQGSPSGNYWILGSSPTRQQYCDMTRTCCDSTGGWMRVANLDMTDLNQQCPSGFRLVTFPKRTCGRPGSGAGCVSTTFPVHGVEYLRVCGRVIGYQYGYPEAFGTATSNIDRYYVDGVSLTHGTSPRSHIWTFANAVDETRSNSEVCRCTRPDLRYTGGATIPSFVGQDYFCETGSRSRYEYRFYSEDPLWDGQGCGSTTKHLLQF